MAVSLIYRVLLLQVIVKIGEGIWFVTHDEDSLNGGRFAKRRRHNQAQASSRFRIFSLPVAGFEAPSVQHLKHEMTESSSRTD